MGCGQRKGRRLARRTSACNGELVGGGGKRVRRRRTRSAGFAIDNLARIVSANDLPVTVDLESGYGETAGEVAQSVARAIEAGAVGFNLEDSFPRDGSLVISVNRWNGLPAPAEPPVIQVLPCSSMHGPTFSSRNRHRPMTKPWSAPCWIAPKYFAKAGADGLFVPGIVDETLIGRLVEGSPLPVNIMVETNTPSLSRLAELGVARVESRSGALYGHDEGAGRRRARRAVLTNRASAPVAPTRGSLLTPC